MLSKVNAYVNFAKRSQSVVYGLDGIEKKRVKLILYSNSLAENSASKSIRLADKYGCKIIKLDSSQFNELFENAKIVGITNASLASAIEGELNQEETN